MSLEKILNAKSVAVVGASKNKTKRGFQAIRILLEENYDGKIYPVNPKEESILGLKCYPGITAIADSVDLALITTPAKTIPNILNDCGEKGVSGAVLIAGGFGESGPQGCKLENEVVAVARKNGIRLIGPNTSGMMNLKSHLNLVGLSDAPQGNIALLTQSGNMALTLITEAKMKSVKGFTYYVGVGNEADIRFHEYLAFFRNDPDTKAVLMYVEGMKDGRKFLEQAQQTTIQKPVILLKSGRSSAGKRSAGSHTGAMAGISEVSHSAFQRVGIIVIENTDELFPATETLSSLPPVTNNGVAILADGGGHATIAADLLTDLGVEIPTLGPETQQQLMRVLPETASVPNPIDLAGGSDADPSVFAKCARIILEDTRVGGILVVGLFGGYGIRFAKDLARIEEKASHSFGKLMKEYQKPIIFHSLFNSMKPKALDILRDYDIPVYDSLDVASKCMAVLAQYGRYLKSPSTKSNFVMNWGAGAREKGVQIIKKAKNEGRSSLLEPEAKNLLDLHGAAVSHDCLAKTPEEAVLFAQRSGGKMVLKIVSPDILHKSDANGVRLGLETDDQIRKAFNDIVKNAREFNPKADIRGVLVSPMAQAGVEVIIGTTIDDQFGPVIMYGLGGIMVEVIKDVAFRVLPISETEADQMIQDTRSHLILKGIRGNPPSDIDALKQLLVTCSDIIEAYPEIKEMDLNPVIVHSDGLMIVDARIILKP